MRVTDSAGNDWTARRRFMPWHRIVQPLNTPLGEYSRYRVVPSGERHENALVKAKQRRESRKSERARKREQTGIKGWQWLYMIPYLIVVIAVVGFVAQAVEVVVFVAGLLLWAVLLPFWLLELIVRLMAGSALWLTRVAGLVRSRVDVTSGDQAIRSLTVILVPGLGNAGHLARALADSRARAVSPFDPHREPAVAQVLASARAQVIRHESVWSTPSRDVVTRWDSRVWIIP